MNRWFHPEFEHDLIAAARYYETQRPRLGGEFLDEAESAVETIMSAPLRWPARIGGVRRFILPLPASDTLSGQRRHRAVSQRPSRRPASRNWQ